MQHLLFSHLQELINKLSTGATLRTNCRAVIEPSCDVCLRAEGVAPVHVKDFHTENHWASLSYRFLLTAEGSHKEDGGLPTSSGRVLRKVSWKSSSMEM